ncbi:CAP domain-containing protein [Asticcacaulis sp.]|uniref:CAP domain-containing protein n=1 Tax=Asticcacaulis sp. TaxID=1872648 RepID=UPI00391BC4CE
MRGVIILSVAWAAVAGAASADEKIQRLDSAAEAAVDALLAPATPAAGPSGTSYRRVNTVVKAPDLSAALVPDAPRFEITDDMQHQAAILLARVNEVRAENGCGPLRLSEQLMQAAQRQSVSMSEKNYVYHYTDDGIRLKDRVHATGYVYTLLGENVAAGQKTADKVFEEWMTSPGHRANILNCGYEEMGVGYVHDAQDQPVGQAHVPYYFYWTQVFGRHMKIAGN